MVPPEPLGGPRSRRGWAISPPSLVVGHPQRVSVRAGTGHLWGSRKLICGGRVEDVGVEWFYLGRT